MKKPNALAVYIALDLLWTYDKFFELFLRKHDYA